MYFEASKKNYYRFPSENSIKDYDELPYYPNIPLITADNQYNQHEASSGNQQTTSSDHDNLE